MLDPDFARRFADDWIASWNSHDLDRIMSHYSEHLEFSSPHIPQIAGEASGVLKGKAAVRAYWAKALKLIPDLRFELVSTLAGIGSIVLYYRNAKGELKGEVFYFGPDGLVHKSDAHGAV
jgi:ketosteroid isomerase-like protein